LKRLWACFRKTRIY